MSGFPFPNSQHKWINVAEAKHPLIQDLIRLWEESPGYILPQASFLKDKAKLEAMIDGLIEMQREKAQIRNTPKLSAPKASTEGAEEKDPNWETNLVLALSSAKLSSSQKGSTEALSLPSLSAGLTKISAKVPGAEEKLAQLKILPELADTPQASLLKGASSEQNKGFSSTHLIILYALSGSAFLLACIALSRLLS